MTVFWKKYLINKNRQLFGKFIIEVLGKYDYILYTIIHFELRPIIAVSTLYDPKMYGRGMQTGIQVP